MILKKALEKTHHGLKSGIHMNYKTKNNYSQIYFEEKVKIEYLFRGAYLEFLKLPISLKELDQQSKENLIEIQSMASITPRKHKPFTPNDLLPNIKSWNYISGILKTILEIFW